MRNPQFLLACVLASLASLLGTSTLAQVTPDQTLGPEGSTVTPNVEVQGAVAELIEGGAVRGPNLFHSFSDFNVSEAERVYFENPTGIGSIFGRITGNSISNIFGTIGVKGTADLFLMNPNGILFGPNSRLDVQGSFIGTTADDIQFGRNGRFNALSPEAPSQILTVAPSAFLFNSPTPNRIINNSINATAVSPSGRPLLGLSVTDSKSLLLVGGDIEMNQGGSLNTLGGRIELGGLAEAGAIALDTDGEFLTLDFPSDRTLSNISLSEDAVVSALPAKEIGSIVVNANILNVESGGRLLTTAEGMAEAANIEVNADIISLEGTGETGNRSGILSISRSDATESSGSIRINSGSIEIQNGASISSVTFGEGNSGNVTVEANILELTGLDATRQFGSGIGSDTTIGSTGNGGNVTILTDVLKIQDGAGISASTRGSGQGGNLQLIANEQANLTGLEITAQGAGRGSGLLAGTFGSGNGGSLQFEGNRLRVQKGAFVASSAFAQGNAGDVSVTADIVELGGSEENRQFVSGLGSQTVGNSTGNAGDVTINTRLLEVRDGATIATSARGSGAGGNLQVIAEERATLAGLVMGSQGEAGPSGLFSTTFGSGRAGALQFEGQHLQIYDGAAISAATAADGAAGNISLVADTIELVGARSIVSSEATPNSTGNGGEVAVSTHILEVRDGARISAGTRGSGSGGDLQVTATEHASLIGTARGDENTIVNSGLFSTTASGGDAGSVVFEGRRLHIQDGAGISVAASGTGDSGDIRIQARDYVDLTERASIATASQLENSSAGDITIHVEGLFSATDSDITTSATNASGGNIMLTADGVRLFGDSDILTNSAQNGGNITLEADSIVALNDSDMFASAAQGRGGAINLKTPAFFGEGYRPEDSENANTNILENNNRVDLNATGLISSGLISTPNTSFIQGELAELPENLVDADQVVASSCIARTVQSGTFIVASTNSLPESQENLNVAYATGAVRSLPVANLIDVELEHASSPSELIVEPQKIYTLADGCLIMGRACSG